MNQESNMPRRSTRRALGVALTAAVIAVVLAVNVLFSFVADRFMWQVDETTNRYINVLYCMAATYLKEDEQAPSTEPLI